MCRSGRRRRAVARDGAEEVALNAVARSENVEWVANRDAGVAVELCRTVVIRTVCVDAVGGVVECCSRRSRRAVARGGVGKFVALSKVM